VIHRFDLWVTHICNFRYYKQPFRLESMEYEIRVNKFQFESQILCDAEEGGFDQSNIYRGIM